MSGGPDGTAVSIRNAAPEWPRAQVQAVVDEHRTGRGPLLPVLHALQERFGHLDRRALDLVADALNLSRAEVHGVATFYRDFHFEPTGRLVVRVCRAEACQSMGAERLLTHATSHLGIELGDTAGDGSVTLEPVFCLGNCALSPSVMIDGQVFGRVTAERFDDLVARAQSE